MTSWESLTPSQRRMLRTAARLCAEGHLYMPQGANQWRTMRSLETLGLMADRGEARHHVTGREGPAFALTPLGARVAAQEPGIDRCHLPFALPGEQRP